MSDPRTIAVHDGRQVSAARIMADLTVAQLAANAGLTTRTISRLEVGGPIQIAGKKRHGHVSNAVWQQIIDALARHGVELLFEGEDHGAGVRWIKPRGLRTTPTHNQTSIR